MTEWDKMQEHQIYNDFDADLFDLRVEAKKLFKEFNRTEDEETERRQDIMRRLFKKIVTIVSSALEASYHMISRQEYWQQVIPVVS